jgi:hypothetical protein
MQSVKIEGKLERNVSNNVTPRQHLHTIPLFQTCFVKQERPDRNRKLETV